MYIIILLVLPVIIYFIIQAAVREGVYNALKDFDEYKRGKLDD